MDEIVKREKETFIRDGVKVTCYQSLYTDENGEDYESGDLIDSNLLARQDAYRKAVGLLTSSEIIEIRKKIGLSQKDFAKMLGLGEIDIVRYETKAVQTKVNNDIILRAGTDYAWLIDKFQAYSSFLSINKRKEVKENIIRAFNEEEEKESFSTAFIKASYFPYGKDSIESGYKELDKKAIASIVYLLQKGGITVYKTLLAKCLYYIDNFAFKKFGKGITGLVYAHQQFGALPLAFNYILEDNCFKIDESIYMSDGKENHTFIVSSRIKNELSESQTELIGSLIPSFKKFTSLSLVNHMHKEESYLQTKPGQIISYSFASSLKSLD